MVYRLIVAYVGTPFVGWQRQRNGLSVQQVLESGLARVVGTEVRVVGASRTDAGVHARGQAAHFELEQPLSESRLTLGTNRFLPPEVRVLSARSMPGPFHARKSALAKEYRYRLSRETVISPFELPFVVRADPRLDVGRMREAAAALRGTHDFSAFARAGGSHTDPRRTIFAADWEERRAELTFRVTGSGFLRGMVRALVGTLLEVGRRRRSIESLVELLEGGDRGRAGPSAPARGLILQRVLYEGRQGAPSL